MRVSICDDDQRICAELRAYIEEYFRRHDYAIPKIVTYNNGIELLQDTETMEIVFLGIGLPGKNGIQIGKELKKKDKNIILFIVAEDYECLDAAMRIQVFRYLTKPIDKRRLFRNMQDAMYNYCVKDKRILIESRDNIYSIRTEDIICIQTDMSEEGSVIHTTKGSYKSLKTLTYWEQALESKAFFRPHRSNIVNMEYVTQFNREEIKLCDDQYTTYMARRHFTQFKRLYLFFLESLKEQN